MEKGVAYTHVKIESFKNQRIFCFESQWISRAEVIEFVANKASGVHSSEPSDQVLPAIRRSFTYDRGENGDINVLMNLPGTPAEKEKPFEYNPKKIDPLLAEILGASRLIVESPDVVRLEEAIRQEIGATVGASA